MTYADELSGYLATKRNISVIQIYLNCLSIKEFKVYEIDSIIRVCIPEKTKKEFDKKYYKRAAQLVYAQFKNLQNVILHSNAPEQFYFTEEAKKLFYCPVVFTFHFLEDFLSYIDKNNLYHQKHNLSGNALPGMMLKISEQIICVTQFASRVVENYYNIDSKKVTVIYNGIHEPKKVSECLSKTELKKKYGFKAEDIVILYAGPLQERKGIAKLIKAFLLVKVDFDDLKLVIAGSGEYDKYLPLIKDSIGSIHFTGKLDKQTLESFYFFSDMGILASHYEQCSYSIIEMKYNRIPIIVSNTPGLNELVKYGVTGLLCEISQGKNGVSSLQADYHDLSLQIITLLNNWELSRHLAENGFQDASKRFSVFKMGEETIKLYKQTLNNLKVKSNEEIKIIDHY